MPTQEQSTDQSLSCDICGADAGIDPWHHSKGASNHIHACENCHSEIVAEQAETERNARRYLALRKVGVQVPGYELVKFDWSLDAAADRLMEECSSQAQNGVGNEQH